MRVYGYRYITGVGGGGRGGAGTRRCACKRVKRRDIFYIYGYLPLLCSRAGGLRQRANRPPSFSSSYSLLYLYLLHLLTSSLSFGTSDCAPSRSRCRSLGYLRSRRSESSVQDAQAGGRTMCHLWCHPIFRSYHDMLKARSTLTLDTLYRCARCPISIYRRGVPCTGYSQHHKKGFRGPSSWLRHFAFTSKVFRIVSIGKSSIKYGIYRDSLVPDRIVGVE